MSAHAKSWLRNAGGNSATAVRSLYSFVSIPSVLLPIILYFVTRSILRNSKQQRWLGVQ